MRKISLRNMVVVVFIIVGTLFFLNVYYFHITHIMDYGYLTIFEINKLNFLLTSIVFLAFYLIIRTSNLQYKSKVFDVRRALFLIPYNTFKIICCLCIAYLCFYYSVTFY